MDRDVAQVEPPVFQILQPPHPRGTEEEHGGDFREVDHLTPQTHGVIHSPSLSLRAVLHHREHSQDEDGVDVGEDVLKRQPHSGPLEHKHVLELPPSPFDAGEEPAERGSDLHHREVLVEDHVEGEGLAEGLGAHQLAVRAVLLHGPLRLAVGQVELLVAPHLPYGEDGVVHRADPLARVLLGQKLHFHFHVVVLAGNRFDDPHDNVLQPEPL